MEMSGENISSINFKYYENPQFWSRCGGKPELKGATVLDIGCGFGGLCVDIALSGAEKVVGVDIVPHSIDIAYENVRNNYPEIKNIIEFECIDFSLYKKDVLFDFIVSKNSFEHIIHLEKMLDDLKKRLKPGGKIYIGFGPLYNSLNGAHMENIVIPWGHILLPDVIFSKILSIDRGRKINSVKELALNRWSFNDYKKLFENSGLSTIYFEINQSSNKLLKLFRLISNIPFLKEYFTISIYCILEEKDN